MKLPKELIKEIAGQLDIGMICFIHKETKALKPMIDLDDSFDTEEWEADWQEIEKNYDEYVRIEKMSSGEAYQIMSDFTEEVKNNRVRNRLIDALNQHKPFQKFKYEVDYNEEVRQQWFKYKQMRYEEWVEKFIRLE